MAGSKVLRRLTLRPLTLTMPDGPNETSPAPAPAGKVGRPVSYQLLLGLVVIVAFAGLAGLRIFRVRTHRDSPAGWQRAGFVVAFLLAPPIVLYVLAAPKSGPGAVDLVGTVVLYLLVVLLVWLLTLIAALVVARFAPIERRQMLLLALMGRDTSGIVAFDPPMTDALGADVERVDALNAAFPRGPAFMGQASLPGFRPTWEALDAATRALEGDIAEQRRLGLGVAQRAIDAANDARGRLDTLRRDAVAIGLAWSV